MRALVLVLLVGCIDQVDQRWDLDHDHVVAVRATPPGVMPYERARIDALVAHDGTPVAVESPDAAVGPQVAKDDPLFDLVAFIGDGWYVTSPSGEALAAVRARDGLAADAAVPIDVLMKFPGDLYAKKTVYLGTREVNPSVPAMVIDGQPAADAIRVPMQQDVYVSVSVEPGARVSWLTSCGSLFQDDVATAFLRVIDEDRREGELAVVIRDPRGGVAWRVWPISADR